MNATQNSPNDGATNPKPTLVRSKENVFAARVRRAADNVLGESPVGREVANLCDRHDVARNLLLEDRGNGVPVVGTVGPAGQGKTTLVRWLLSMHHPQGFEGRKNQPVLKHREEPRLIWYGSKPPAYLDSLQEDYQYCHHAEMESIGLPYLLLDGPACNDEQLRGQELASRTLALASVILLVIRADQIRSEAVTFLTQLSEGSIVVPVINAIRTKDEALDHDVQALLTRLRQLAPSSLITDPVLVEDFELAERSEAVTASATAHEIARQIQGALGGEWEHDKRRFARLASLERRFHQSLHNVLSDQLPGLTSAVTRLRHESMRIPTEIAEQLVGRGGPMQAAIRTRLRLTLLTETAAYWFPYRSLLGVLNLTHGAWDRLLISFSGSLPSLISAMWTSSAGRQSDDKSLTEVRKGLQYRGEVAVAERLGPLAAQFRQEVNELHSDNNNPPYERTRSSDSCVAKLSGLETLQGESQLIFDSEVDRASISRLTACLLGLLGTVIFWGLLSAPILALYSEYMNASSQVFELLGESKASAGGNPIRLFPTPQAAMLMTSLVLSLLPTAIFSMIVLSIAQSHRRVRATEGAIRRRHHQAIETLQRSGVLQLQWDDPLLTDAEFLLTAGAGDSHLEEIA